VDTAPKPGDAPAHRHLAGVIGSRPRLHIPSQPSPPRLLSAACSTLLLQQHGDLDGARRAFGVAAGSGDEEFARYARARLRALER